MTLIHKDTKSVDSQPWRFENWLGKNWIEVPAELEAKVFQCAPYCVLEFETVMDEETGKSREVLTAILSTERPAEELNTAKKQKQAENNMALSEYLETHPITWNDGLQYGVTQGDQQEIALNLTQYQLSTATGVPAKLEWHAVHEECREFTPEELTGLAVAISKYVYPLVRKNQAIKAQIYTAASTSELEGISIGYDT